MTLAQLKRTLQVGMTLTLTATNLPQAQKLLNIPRVISKVQTNALTLITQKENKVVNSWLYFPPAKLFTSHDDKTFTFADEYGGGLTYTITP